MNSLRKIGLVTAWVALSCGEQVPDGSGGTGGESMTGASSQNGTSTTEATTDGSGSGSGSGSVGNPTDGESCEGFGNEDEPTLRPVEVSIVNTSRAPIVLAQIDCSGLYVGVESLVEGVPGGYPGDVCGFTCDDVLAGDCVCGIDCGPTEAIRLEPGGTYPSSWNGSFLARFDPPTQCYTGESCIDQTCEAVRTAPDGPIRLQAQAAPLDTACDDPTACDCQPNADGWCAVPPDFGASMMASVEITLPTETATIEF